MNDNGLAENQERDAERQHQAEQQGNLNQNQNADIELQEQQEDNVNQEQNADIELQVDQQVNVIQEVQAIWEFERKFANKTEFDRFLAEECCWSLLKIDHLQKGTKTVWRRGKQCNSGLYSLETPNSDEIEVFRKRAEHDCATHDNHTVSKVDEKLKKFILEQYKLGNPPATIIFKLREMKEIQQPTKQQVTHIINYYKEKLPSPAVTISEMEKFVNEHVDMPDSDDEPFVISFEFSQPRTNEGEKFFRLFYSTKRLLKHAVKSKTVHADGTYKIMVQGYPVLVVGISDADKHFHLCGIGITSSESTADYTFLFNSLRIGVLMAAGEELKPGKLVADMAIPITNGFKEAFTDVPHKRIHCFAHLMANVQKQKFNNAENKEAIKGDISKLQLVHNGDLFNTGWKLLAKKWKDKEPDFIQYFEDVYIKTFSNWYEGYSNRTPSTNNCCEVFNRLLKQQQMLSTKQPLNQFLHHALTIVQQRSKEYIADKQPPIMSVTLKDGLMLRAWKYSESEKSMAHETLQVGTRLFYVFSGDNMAKITLKDVRKWEKSKHKNFDDFVANTSSI